MNKSKNFGLKKTIIFFIICLLFGLCFGFLVGIFSKHWGGAIELSVLAFFNAMISFIAFNNVLVLSIVWIPFTLIALVLLSQAKSIVKKIPIDEVLENKVDFYLSIGLVLNSIALIYTFLIFGCSISPDSPNIILYVITFLTTFTLNIYIETYVIKLIKILHPQKKGNPMDLNFQKQWIESCDEAERMMTYVVGFKVFVLMQNLLIFTFVVLMLLRLSLGISCLSLFIVALLWSVLTVANSVYAYKIEKGKIKY